jgi:hypothetical protein
VRAALPFDVIDLVGALQGLIDPLHHLRHRVRGIETLVRIHVAGQVRVRGDLPAAEIDRLETRAHLLHGLIARERAQRVHVRLGVEELPEPLGAHLRQRVPDVDRTAQAQHVFGRVVADDAFPARVGLPLPLHHLGVACLFQSGHACSFSNAS